MSSKEMPRIVLVSSAEAAREWLQSTFSTAECVVESVPYKGTLYGIEDIRKFRTKLQLKARVGQGHVAYFDFGISISPEAQQALLLTLEDLPPGHDVILFAMDCSGYLATILSRCSVVNTIQNSSNLTGDILERCVTFSNAIELAKELNDKQDVKSLVIFCMQTIRQQAYASTRVVGAMRFYMDLFQRLGETTVSPRLVAEIALLSYIRIRNN